MKHKRLLIGLGLLALGTAVFAVFVRRHFDPALFRQLACADVFILTGLYIATIWFNAFNIKMLFKGLGFAIPVRKILMITLATGAITIATPLKIGVPIRILLYRRLLAIPYGAGVMEVALESLLRLLSIFIFLLLPSRIYTERGLYFALLLALGILAMISWFAFRQLIKLFPDQAILKRLMIKVQDALSGFRRMSPWYRLYLLIAFPAYLISSTLMSWYILNRVAGCPVALIDLVFTENISYLSATLSMVPLGGLGVKEVVFSSLLAQIGVPANLSVSALVLYRFYYTFGSLCLGGLVWLFLIARKAIRPGTIGDNAA